MNHVRRFMWARRIQNGMEDWKPLDFTGDEEAVVGEQPPMPEGLETDAATLQALFESSNDHLADVRQRHTEVLITAGMLPESRILSPPWLARRRRKQWPRRRSRQQRPSPTI